MIGRSAPPVRLCRASTLAILLLVAALATSCAPSATPLPAVPPTAAPAPATNTPPPSPVAAAASPSPSPAGGAAPSPVASPAAVPSPSPSPSPAAAVSPPTRKLNVVATTTQIQDFVRNVGADRVNVVPILPAATDPHDYQPTAEDARKLAMADVVFSNGVGLEPWIEDLAKNVRPGVPVVDLAQAASLSLRAAEHSQGEEEEHGHPEGDPHVWYDPTNVQKMVGSIRDTLSRAEPPGAADYQANAAAYQRQLDQLDQQIRQLIATVPPEQRKLVTNHESYGYYTDRYGLDLVGAVIPSTSTEAEPSAADLQQLIQEIRQQNVKAIFTQRGGNTRLEEQVARQAGVTVISDLYAETLGPPGSDGDTYLKAMLHDTRVIVEGLR